MDTHQQAERLRALWKSGQDKFRSFFAVLAEVHQEIGDAALADWCFDELRIGLTVILKAAELIPRIEEEKAKAELAHATKLEKQKRAMELAAQRKAREDAILARERKKAEHAKQLAQLHKEQTAEEIKRKKMEDTERRRQQKQTNPNERGPKANARAARRKIMSSLSDAELSELQQRFHAAEKLCDTGIARWIEGSIAKAKLLYEMRTRLPADIEFGEWLVNNKVELESHARGALINLGRLDEKHLREIFENTDSRSYRTIWEQNKPMLSVVGGD